MEIKDRIEQFRLEKGLTVQKFEKVCGFSNAGWVGADSISERNLLRFIRAYPEVDASWLLKGEPSPKKPEDIQPEAEELLALCKMLIANHQQRDEVMSRLASMVQRMDI